MTTINYRRTGGATGRDLSVNLDLNEMPGDASQLLHNLILESDFFKTPVQETAMARPDEFDYTVTIERANATHTVHTTDTSMPEPLRPLIEALTQLAKTAENR